MLLTYLTALITILHSIILSLNHLKGSTNEQVSKDDEEKSE